jgi:predicted phage terminase large subunit-like protein
MRPPVNNPPRRRQSAAQAQISTLRRDASEHSLRVFCQTYLSHYCECSFSSMHRELFELLESATIKRDARLAVAAPRNSAKTTLVSTAYALWSICYKKEEFIFMVSATTELSTNILAHVKRELETNERLIEDFPEACEVPGMPPKAPRWRMADIITRNGVNVAAASVGTNVRGRKYKQHRPTLILADDLENREHCYNSDQRIKTREWFEGSLAKMGSTRTNIVVVGTILHYDSLLSKLTDPAKSPGWTGKTYRSVISWSDKPELWSEWENIYRRRTDFNGSTGPEAALQYFQAHQEALLSGTSVLWPERESYYTLMVSREREGRTTFDCEKQNDPSGGHDSMFPEQEMHFWDDDGQTLDELLTRIGKAAVVVGACDPSMGNARRIGRDGSGGDYSAIILLVWDSATTDLYVIDADIRRRKPDALVRDALQLYSHRRCSVMGFETNGFQELLAKQFSDTAMALGMDGKHMQIRNTSNKRGRIERLQPLIRSGQLKLSRRHNMLIDQLRQFPLGAHDDGPDALEMAVHTVEEYAGHLLSEANEADRRALERYFQWQVRDL